MGESYRLEYIETHSNVKEGITRHIATVEMWIRFGEPSQNQSYPVGQPLPSPKVGESSEDATTRPEPTLELLSPTGRVDW